MDILGFIAGHQSQFVALIVAAVTIGLAKKGIHYTSSGKRERQAWARWTAFVLYIIGGLALAVAAIPLLMWVLSKVGGFGTFVIGTATLALGWHSVALLVSMVRDLMDKVPDHEARTAALWFPTLAPIGVAAVVQLLRNPQGLGQGLTAVSMAVVTLVYAFSIVKRVDKAKEHRVWWNWFAFGVLVLAGIIIVPLYAYIDTALIANFVPGRLQWAPRLLLGLTGAAAVAGAIFDILFDGTPNQWARRGAIYGIPASLVFGAIALSSLTGATEDGASMLNRIF